MVNFDNTEVSFRYKPDVDLDRAYFLFKMIEHPWMVNAGKALVKLAFALRLPVKRLIKKTAFNHFCGGETIEECERRMDELHEYRVFTILDYGVEGKESEKDFDHALEVALKTIVYAKDNPAIPFTVFKPTGMGRFKLYEKVNAGEILNDKEQAEWDRVVARYDQVCALAHEHNLPVMIDAEETWIQTAVDNLVLEMMRKYNKETQIVYNTLQMYRRERIPYLMELLAIARRENFKIGLKIVRGAYMEKERERAREMNYIDPIHENKKATDKDYNLAMRIIVENIDVFALCAGTHNELSSQLLVDYMEELGIAKDDTRIYFSQLYGMSDHISFNIANAGYNVVKYLPYGPVENVMPYLFRRAEENTSIEGQTGRELSLLMKERKRRKLVLATGNLGPNVK
jgi:proline dehydrogenase